MSDIPHPQTLGPILPELSAYRPGDYLRLLNWIFLKPECLQRYKTQYGKNGLDRIGTWLTLFALWVPLTIPILGHTLQCVPLSDTVATIFLVAMPISAWFVYTRNDMVGAQLSVLFLMIHVVDKSAADGDVNVAFAGNAMLQLAFLIGLLTAIPTQQNWWPMVGFLITSAGAGTWVAFHVGGQGLVLGFVIAMLMAVVWSPVVVVMALRLENRFGEGWRSVLVPFLALVVLVAQIVLVWIYLLDGWTVLLIDR